MPACQRKTQRPGRGRSRYLPPHDVRDARQLELRRLFQERSHRLGLGTAHRSLQAPQGPALRHGLRGLRPGRPRRRQRSPRLLAPVSPGRPHPDGQQARQLLGNGRHRSLRPLQRDPHRPARRRGARRHPGGTDGQPGPSPGHRNLEPGVHAVQPQGQRIAGAPARKARRHRHGPGAPLHGHPGQEEQLRHRRLHRHDRRHREAERRSLPA